MGENSFRGRVGKSRQETKKGKNIVLEEEKNENIEETSEETVVESAEVVEETAEAQEEAPKKKVLRASRAGRGERKSRKEKTEKPASDWTERVVQIRRVTKVVKGGKKLSFRAVVIAGDGKGHVGVGCGKSSEVVGAIQKAVVDARKNSIEVPVFKTTIPHISTGRSGAGSVVLKPASQGTGVIAGGAVRSVLELAGIENILSKSLGSKSPLNAARATMEALKAIKPFKVAAAKRGLTVKEMLN